MQDGAIVFGLADPDRSSTRREDAPLLAAAADAIAALVDQPAPDAIVPDVLDERLVGAVAAAVAGCGR
ncbi:MAG TPA: hypothetical protein VI452_06215 [Marmoricola sp.]